MICTVTVCPRTAKAATPSCSDRHCSRFAQRSATRTLQVTGVSRRSEGDEYNFARDDLRLVLRDQFLKARIVAQRVPFPTEFQIVERDAVIDAVHRAWSFQQALDERNSKRGFARVASIAFISIEHHLD